jgi:hypothetical protein
LYVENSCEKFPEWKETIFPTKVTPSLLTLVELALATLAGFLTPLLLF